MNDTKTILRKMSTLDKEQSIEFLRNIERVRMDDDEIILALLDEIVEEHHESRQPISSKHIADYLIDNGVVVQKHGRWEDLNTSCVVTLGCSLCRKEIPFGKTPYEMHYCPNCGAKMDGGTDGNYL